MKQRANIELFREKPRRYFDKHCTVYSVQFRVKCTVEVIPSTFDKTKAVYFVYPNIQE